MRCCLSGFSRRRQTGEAGTGVVSLAPLGGGGSGGLGESGDKCTLGEGKAPSIGSVALGTMATGTPAVCYNPTSNATGG
jgi:hypothetical protein